LGEEVNEPTPAERAKVSLLAKLDEVELKIEKLVAGGDGLGRYERLPVFVPRSAPGDRLRVRIVDRRTQYARGEIVEILEPGPGRREPPCKHFSDCGGCDLQHLEDELQVELKVAAARETLLRIGKLQLPERQRVLTATSWGYRLRTQLQLEPAEERARAGYFARGSHRIVEVSECPVLIPALEQFVIRLCSRLPEDSPKRLDVTIGDGDIISCAPAVADLPRGEVRLAAGGNEYGFDARTFFQGHRGLLDDLIECVVGDGSGELLWDLYAGVGLFSIPLARRYKKVVAVEGDRIAVRYLRKNAQRARLENLEATVASVEAAVKNLPASIDRVVVDPPRAGLGFRVRADLFDRRPRRLTYVSCHPAVLARDLKHLCRIYQLEELTFVDLFPQTGHIEVVAQLRLDEQSKE
jgi:23S rRNA (uracil1939-C5)-methyltransferase